MTDQTEISVFVRRQLMKGQHTQEQQYLTFGACGVFGFWKNLVISAFCALIRCNQNQNANYKHKGRTRKAL